VVAIRAADVDDLDSLTGIYNHAVVASYATFDEEPQAASGRRAWFEQFAEHGRHRLLVACVDESAQREAIGYACSQRYRPHPAFDETVEFSIYLAPDAQGRGVGTALYDALFDALRDEAVYCVVVGIALPNDASVALHRRFGFRDVGVFEQYAIKQGRRISSLWMQRLLR
jgi:phosphinothricin acetyltransferase